MSAQQELLQLKGRLQKQISVLEAEMATVDKAIQLLDREGKFATATGTTGQDKRFSKMGLSEACREIVGSNWTLPSEVRNQMLQGGFKTADKAGLLSSVFATLKRLATKDLEGAKIDGKMRYRKRQSTSANTEDAA